VLALALAVSVSGCPKKQADAPAPAAEAADSETVFDIPKLSTVAIDGDAADWAGGGFRVGWMTHARFGGGDLKGPAEFDPRFRLGWSDEGLLLLLTVRDDSFAPAADDEALWANRADVVIVYVIPERGADAFTRIAIAPNATGVANNVAELPQPRVLVSVDATQTDREEQPSPYRAVDLAEEGPDISAGLGLLKGGYVLEVLIPWEVVGLTGELRSEFGVQVGLVDSDPTEDGGLEQGAAMWHPALGTAGDTTRSNVVRLARGASDPVLASLSNGDNPRYGEVFVEGASELDGKTVDVRAGRKVVATAVLATGEGGWPFARLRFRCPVWDPPFNEVDVFVDGERLGAVTLRENAARRAAEAILFQDIKFGRYVLSEPQFPWCDFEDPDVAAGILGPYQLNVTYYDADYNEVLRADEPGRYGAVVEVVPEDGRPFKRFVTLFRMPDEPGLDRSGRVEAPVAEWLGLPDEIAEIQSDFLGSFVKWKVINALIDTEEGAVLIAGLHETPAGAEPNDFYGEPDRLDLAWWVGLKRKLYGWQQRWPEPFVCPRPIDGAPATVVHDGTLAEAGMKADARDNIDAILTEWAGDTDEAFAVCIVRRGVIVLHKAYGLRDGDPMTVTNESWMASTTKMLSGTLLMMMVDQGLMDLEDPIQDYLPALAEIETNEPLTIRRLHNHTNDFDWHFGNGVVDLSERLAILLPLLNVGGEYRYNGTGMELNTKVIEAISGESLPQFYKNHLLDPLGCENTNVSGASGDAHSVPLDMARIAQMLLNKGAYGDMRFFSAETFEQMLPQPVIVEGEPSVIQYGVGMSRVDADGLSAGSFTHGAASSAMTWIDPANELVICMTRNNAGENFYEYNWQFVKAVVDGMIDPVVEEE